jgi:hypothetical protein
LALIVAAILRRPLVFEHALVSLGLARGLGAAQADLSRAIGVRPRRLDARTAPTPIRLAETVGGALNVPTIAALPSKTRRQFRYQAERCAGQRRWG